MFLMIFFNLKQLYYIYVSIMLCVQTFFKKSSLIVFERIVLMRTIYVVTCGTSILTNGASETDRIFLRENANKLEQDYSPEERDRLENIAASRRETLLGESDEARICRCSAELNGFLNYRRANLTAQHSAGDMAYFVCTDTFQGKLTAGILADWSRKHEMAADVVKVEDLNTASVESFHNGVNNLIEWCRTTLPASRERGSRIVFNLIGGFKTLQGYMQTLGMLYADEIFYIFESGREIITIPRLPLDISSAAQKAIRAHLAVVRRMNYRDLPAAECAGLPETMLTVIDGQCTLSAWGRVIFDQVKKELYQERLQPPMIDSFEFSPGAKNDAEKLDPQQRRMLNNAIDDFGAYLETGQNLQRLDFRALKGNRKPPSTYEFNTWSTQNGWRAFCHYEQDRQKWIIDSFDVGIGH